MSAVLQKKGRKRIAGTGRFAYNGDGLILSRRDGSLDGSVFKQNTAAGQPATGAALGRMNLHNVYANGQQVAGLDEAGKLDVLSRLTAFSSSDAGRALVVVQAGETLQSLAQRVYGNAGLWYVIAGANGLDSDADLAAGSSLTVPEVRTSSNDASTFKPYNPGEITGPTSPGLPYIAPPDAGCGTVGMIIMVAVAVVVAFYVGPAALAYFEGVMGTGAGAVMAAGAVTGAASTATSTAAGSAMGVASFSWRGVAAGAVTGAATAGIASRFGTVGEAIEAGNYGKAAAVAVGNASVNYAGQKLAGVDVSFSWSSIAASAVSSVTSAKLAGKVDLGSDFANDFALGMGGGVVSASVRRAMGEGGRSDYMTIVVDAFGNALGNAVVRGGARVPGSMLQGVDEQSGATDWGPFTPYAVDDGGPSFLERYPYATAALGNGDAGYRNAIDVKTGNALLAGQSSGTDLAPVEAQSPYVVGATEDGALNLARVVVTPDAAQNAWYMALWDWSNTYHQPAPPTEGGRDGMVRYWSEQSSRLTPAYNAYMQQAYEGRTVSGPRPGMTDAQIDEMLRNDPINRLAGKALGVVMPNLMEMDARGIGWQTPTGDEWLSAGGKWVGNAVIGMANLASMGTPGGLMQRLSGQEGIPSFHYTDREFSAAMVYDGATLIGGVLTAEANLGRSVAGVGRSVVANTATAERSGIGRSGAYFFDQEVLPYIDRADATLGVKGSSQFFMPLEDSVLVADAATAYRYSGGAPSLERAYLSGGDVFGVEFPLEGFSPRLPTAADTTLEHFLEGGNTALRLPGNGGYLVNPTRELVVPGGSTMPSGAVLFRIGPHGERIPLRGW